MNKLRMDEALNEADEPSRFKFVFEDSQVSFVNAPTYREAAILIAANRIRAKKNFKIIGAWAQSGKEWEVVKQDCVTIQLG